jgi:cardiolipin synthase
VTLPNILSLGRLLAAPLLVWIILIGDFRIAFWIFLAAAVSDGLDGLLARLLHQRSTLGTLLDPLADKTLLAGACGTLGVLGALPSWIVIAILARDVMILGGFVLTGLLTGMPVVQPLVISKINTALQFLLIGLTLARFGWNGDMSRLSTVLIALVGVSTGASAGAYLVRWSGMVEGRGR